VAITETVREQIARDVPDSRIDVATEQGKVALSGTVDDAEAARKAVKNALAVEGVRGVVNELQVQDEKKEAPELRAAAL
jgi:osmotically-inducible protein OsmY